jgi:hypothetical protein
MDLINANQVYGLLLFFFGAFVLTLCNRYERKVDEKLRDPKQRWMLLDGVKDGVVRRKSIIGTLLTIVGGAISLAGLVFFLVNIK